ncbi:MAG: hypothetical protein KF914_14855 [Rhizobiaceae bacterium]|nr:hypothetical protein [Rhizobiaceae bacterium]
MAGLSALATLLAAIVEGIVALWMERRRLHVRQGELLVAIHAEIVAGLKRVEEQTATEEQEYAINDDDPFGIPDETDFVFESIKENPAVLPRDVIHSVVRYYKLAAQSNAMTKGLLDPLFHRQPGGAKRKFVGQIIDLMREQEKAAMRALEDIEREAASRSEPDLARYRQPASSGDIRSAV